MNKIESLNVTRGGFSEGEIKSGAKSHVLIEKTKGNKLSYAIIPFSSGKIVVEFKNKKTGKLVSSIEYGDKIVGYGREKISEYNVEAEKNVAHYKMIKKADRAMAYTY